jgi:hypothetical protein
MEEYKQQIYKIVKDYFDAGHYTSMYIEIDTFYKYIDNIFNDQSFLNNPIEYLKKWREDRGDTEEYRLPEDDLYCLFYNIFIGA